MSVLCDRSARLSTSLPSTSKRCIPPAAIDAVLHAADYSHFGFVLASLIAHAGCESNQLGEVAAVEPGRDYFLLRDRAGNAGSWRPPFLPRQTPHSLQSSRSMVTKERRELDEPAVRLM